jgi:DNA-binding NarL/FixJ family response regulator
MPRRTGLDALPEIKRVAPAAKIIVVSGFVSAMIAADVLARGADRYIEKGADPNAIAAMIEEVATARAPGAEAWSVAEDFKMRPS